MNKYLYLDMDGCMSDLYAVPDWLNKLRNEDCSPYVNAAPIVNMRLLQEVLEALKDYGYKIGVITWGSKEAKANYDRAVCNAKIHWLQRYGIWQNVKDNFHFLHYGIPKATVIKKQGTHYLIDDEERNRKNWYGTALDPTENGLLEVLYDLLESETGE